MAVEDAVCLADKAEAADGSFRVGIPGLPVGELPAHGMRQLMVRFLGDVYHAGGPHASACHPSKH